MASHSAMKSDKCGIFKRKQQETLYVMAGKKNQYYLNIFEEMAPIVKEMFL